MQILKTTFRQSILICGGNTQTPGREQHRLASIYSLDCQRASETSADPDIGRLKRFFNFNAGRSTNFQEARPTSGTISTDITARVEIPIAGNDCTIDCCIGQP